jgi:hypothetical protein
MIMKNLYKTVVGCLAVLALSAATGVFANTIVLSKDSYSYKVGGEFSAVTTGQNFTKNYSSKAIVNGGFETFCVETTVPFTSGQPYTYTLSSQDSLGRSLSKGAAFLYYEFAKGILAGYNYANAVNMPSRATDAGLLQAAIWWFQGEQTYAGFAIPTSINNPFYALAVTTLGSLANALSANNGLYSVEIIQLTDSSGKAAQNQLVLCGVPDGGVTVALLGASLASLFLIQLKIRKSG